MGDMYGEEEGQYHSDSVYYQGNGNSKGNSNTINDDEVIRECASILRELSEVEWEELKRRLPQILPEIENEDQLGIFPRDGLIPYLKSAVALDNRNSPKLQVTNKLYNQHTITAISEYLNYYAMSFDKKVFLELLDDIQDPTDNVVSVNIPNIPYGTSNSQAEFNLKKMSKNERQAYNNRTKQNMRNLFGNVGSLPTRRGGRKRKTSKQSKARRRRSRTVKKRN